MAATKIADIGSRRLGADAGRRDRRASRPTRTRLELRWRWPFSRRRRIDLVEDDRPAPDRGQQQQDHHDLDDPVGLQEQAEHRQDRWPGRAQAAATAQRHHRVDRRSRFHWSDRLSSRFGHAHDPARAARNSAGKSARAGRRRADAGERRADSRGPAIARRGGRCWRRSNEAPRDLDHAGCRTSSASSSRAGCGSRSRSGARRRARRSRSQQLADGLKPSIAQHLGARPLGEAQVVGVVDDAAGVGVLVVDADAATMDAAVAHALRIGSRHRRPRPAGRAAPAARGCRQAEIAVAARGRAARPRGVRCSRPCCIR